MTLTRVKICGLTEQVGLKAAVDSGAAYVGFVFFEKSPRHLTVEAARALAIEVPAGIVKVALTVNATDATLDAINDAVPIDMWQLHGAETPDRVSAVKARYGLPVMKALGVADAADLDQIATYATVADQLLIDAKPPKGAALPGGNGLAFDWRLLSDFRWPVPWMLAGGLIPDTVPDALRLTKATQLDVSSGVESAPGVKDPERIAAFLNAAETKTRA